MYILMLLFLKKVKLQLLFAFFSLYRETTFHEDKNLDRPNMYEYINLFNFLLRHIRSFKKCAAKKQAANEAKTDLSYGSIFTIPQVKRGKT